MIFSNRCPRQAPGHVTTHLGVYIEDVVHQLLSYYARTFDNTHLADLLCRACSPAVQPKGPRARTMLEVRIPNSNMHNARDGSVSVTPSFPSLPPGPLKSPMAFASVAGFNPPSPKAAPGSTKKSPVLLRPSLPSMHSTVSIEFHAITVSPARLLSSPKHATAPSDSSSIWTGSEVCFCFSQELAHSVWNQF